MMGMGNVQGFLTDNSFNYATATATPNGLPNQAIAGSFNGVLGSKVSGGNPNQTTAVTNGYQVIPPPQHNGTLYPPHMNGQQPPPPPPQHMTGQLPQLMLQQPVSVHQQMTSTNGQQGQTQYYVQPQQMYINSNGQPVYFRSGKVII
jgi:hypothetical protein